MTVFGPNDPRAIRRASEGAPEEGAPTMGTGAHIARAAFFRAERDRFTRARDAERAELGRLARIVRRLELTIRCPECDAPAGAPCRPEYARDHRRAEEALSAAETLLEGAPELEPCSICGGYSHTLSCPTRWGRR